jgi:ribosomal protein S18 acetylase RimI-like enzyme
MNSLIFKQSLVNLPSLEPVYELFRRCERFDGFMPKIYWHTLRERCTDPNALDYLCYKDNILVGMLNILFFSEAAEITVLIDPDFRGQKIFKKLLTIALNKLHSYVVSHYMLISPYTCRHPGAVWDHDEIEMRAPENISEPSSLLTLHRADPEDAAVLAGIHIECFEKPDRETMEARFSVSLLESNRRAYIAKNEKGDAIGKLHAREDFNRVLVHDVGIKKDFRRLGYGKVLMLNWLKEHSRDYGDKPIAVEVLGNNTSALKLYESCGFTTTHTYHFWKFAL